MKPSIRQIGHGAPARGRLSGLVRRCRAWAWAPLLGRLLVWVIAFLGLAHVGSGAAARALGLRPLRAAEQAAPEPAAAPAPDGGSAQPKAGVDVATVLAELDAGVRDAQAPPAAITKDGRVVLNLATERELVTLPGIGKKRAQAILALRARLQRFRRVEDLLRVRGIGYRSLRKLRPLVTVDPPREK